MERNGTPLCVKLVAFADHTRSYVFLSGFTFFSNAAPLSSEPDTWCRSWSGKALC